MNSQIAKKIIEQTRKNYDRIADHFAKTRQEHWYEVSALIKQYLNPSDTVLDLGCGNGRVAEFVNEIKANYTGLDSSERLIQIARQLHDQNDFRIGDILKTPFSENSFNHILMIASFHHIPSKDLRLQALKEAKRLLKPQGKIIMTNWNLRQIHFWCKRLKFLLEKITFQPNVRELDFDDLLIPWKNMQGEIQAQRYYHSFTPREIKKLAAKTELTIIDQYYETNGQHLPWYSGQNLVTIFANNVQ